MRPENLTAHPEGGRFREVHRSAAVVRTDDGRERSALTHIYFALAAGEVSRFHRVASDEVWNLYRGDGVVLLLWDGGTQVPLRIELSAASGEFCHVVPAGWWQAAAPLGGEVLVGCSVGPGFDFADFTLLTSDRPEAARLRGHGAEFARFVAS
jgi:predicted cupin superfamily sugar epimerase